MMTVKGVLSREERTRGKQGSNRPAGSRPPLDAEYPSRRDAPAGCAVRSRAGDGRARVPSRRGQLLERRAIQRPLSRALVRGLPGAPVLPTPDGTGPDADPADRLAGLRDGPDDRHLRRHVVLRPAVVMAAA